jgi:hypothetical protein
VTRHSFLPALLPLRRYLLKCTKFIVLCQISFNPAYRIVRVENHGKTLVQCTGHTSNGDNAFSEVWNQAYSLIYYSTFYYNSQSAIRCPGSFSDILDYNHRPSHFSATAFAGYPGDVGPLPPMFFDPDTSSVLTETKQSTHTYVPRLYPTDIIILIRWFLG